MKRINKTYSSILIAAALILASFAIYEGNSEAFIHNLKLQLDKYSNRMPHEKTYLHTDKTFYKPGEIVWFKAYVLNGSNNEPTTKSEVVYVELINPKGNVETTLTLPTVNGGAKGEFLISENMPGGIYKLRSYTNWMKNFGEDFYFEKEVQVQKVIFPRLLMKIDFAKEAYGAGDKVDASLSLRTLEDKALANKEFSFTVSVNGESILVDKEKTDNKGEAVIRFQLPDKLSSNDGLLNAIISHEGNSESVSRSIPIILNNISLEFFPEGGDLLRNYKNSCAFKALDEFGKPADIDGEIYDDKDNLITNFSSYHQGMGNFKITPDKNAYYAKITRPKNIEKKYPLPQILKNGYLLNLKDRNEKKLIFRIAAPHDEELSLIGQVNGEVYFSKTLQLKKGENSTPVEISSLPAGILQVTLFDNYDVARCERLVFINKNKTLKIKVSPSKKEYQPREKVELTVQTFDKDSIPVPAQISLAVVNDKVISFADDKQDNILSYLLMSSELKGKIEEPNFYFDEKEVKADTALDYVMLTNGWRRFTWEQVLDEDYKMEFFAEKASSVSGRILDRNGLQPLQATVTLMELSGEQRAAQVKTTDKGVFIFLNTDPSAQKKIIVNAPGIKPENIQIRLDKTELAANTPLNSKNSTSEFLPVMIKEKIEEESLPKENKEVFKPLADENFDAVLVEDFADLEEIVVVGYGMQKKADLTGSVVEIRADDIDNGNIEQLLQGRVAGLNIQKYAPGTGEAVDLRIRGANSVASNEPLFVVDGVPLSSMPDSKISPIGYLKPEDIESISVLKDAASTAIYGANGAAGIIVITTKNENHNGYRSRTKYPKKRYCVIDVPTKNFSRVRHFYCPNYEKSKNAEERSDFRTTIYWNPDIKTDKNGKATVSFYNSDEITTFRAISEGIGAKGLIGRSETTYFTQLPFTIETKIPPYMTFGDIVEIPVLLKNNTFGDILGKLKVKLPKAMELIEEIPSNILIPANGNITQMLKCKVLPIQGKYGLNIEYKAKGIKDAVNEEIEIQAKGFPVKASISGSEGDKQYIVMLSDPLEGSVKAKFTSYPDVTSDLMSGIESILREPYGCFEQTSSSTYPNIMVLQYLEETGTANPALYKRAVDLIDRGYKRLTSYETSSKGYEWFGSAPGHESLTAYGLMEFIDMSKVYDGVDNEMIKRTLDWILKRRDGKGNFKLNSKALDSFGRASQEVVNAYVVYALSESGFKDIETEYSVAYKEAITSKDPYRLSLMANAGFNMSKSSDANKLMEIMRSKLAENDFENIQIDHSITRSYGNSLQIETASIYMLALLKEENKSISDLKQVSEYLINSRCGGGFGSTQATILALKSLTEFAKFSKHVQSDGTIEIYVNGELFASKKYEAGETGEITIDSIQKALKKGANSVRIKFVDTQNTLPYTFDAEWTSLTPNSAEECVIDLSTQISKSETKVGETVRLTATLTNRTSKGQPMTMAILGIPAGLSAQPWQLKELQEKKVFDYYEVRKNYIMIYYRQMLPNENHVINLDLKAEVAGEYTAPASTGYLYYTNEFKDWESGSFIKIRQ